MNEGGRGRGFSGPLFIVGMPRSGTKLVRALLNQSSAVNLSRAESHFIPYLVRRFGEPPGSRRAADTGTVLAQVAATPFGAALRQSGVELGASFTGSLELGTWSAFFERLLRAAGPRPERPEAVWGDKSPGYVGHMPLLKRLFPAARFLHVVRDPRDQCLSIERSFGKDPVRAAHRWQSTLRRASSDAALLGPAYSVLHYEELTADPERSLERVCVFLEIPFEDRMLRLESTGETLGDARGVSGILRGNSGKWSARWPPRRLARIEEIVAEVAELYGYRITTPGRRRPLGRLERLCRYLMDGLPTARHHLRVEGRLGAALQRLVVHYRVSSWRRHV